MKNGTLSNYQMPKKEVAMLWLNNYECCESIKDLTIWTRFQSIDELSQRLVMNKPKEKDEDFRFRLTLNVNEEMNLQDYLLKRKKFIVNYIYKRGSFSPGTHLYQFYLQYLPHELNEVEKNILLDGYMLLLSP